MQQQTQKYQYIAATVFIAVVVKTISRTKKVNNLPGKRKFVEKKKFVVKTTPHTF